MLDPEWTSERGYGHALFILAQQLEVSQVMQLKRLVGAMLRIHREGRPIPRSMWGRANTLILAINSSLVLYQWNNV